jgi:hypothetical protein
MKQLSVIFVSVMLIMTMGCQAGDSGSSTNTGTGDKKLTLDSERAKASYCVGYNMGRNLKNIEGEVDIETVVQGFRDGFAGEDKAQVSIEEIPEILKAFQMRMKRSLKKMPRM